MFAPCREKIPAKNKYKQSFAQNCIKEMLRVLQCSGAKNFILNGRVIAVSCLVMHVKACITMRSTSK